MTETWRSMRLREAGVKLIDCVHKTPTALPTGYPYIAIPQMSNGRIDFSTARRISAADFDLWTKKAKPQAWDIVLSRRRNPGETALVAPGEEFAVGQNLVLLRADGKTIHPPFLRWLTRSPEWWVQIQKNLNVGAVFDSLKCADVPNFELRVPPRSDQGAIAETLGSLDDKIEQNRRTGRALEGLARAVFKAWFVDFEPVKAKASGATAFPGMPAAAFAALPTRLVDSELGPVPEGWELRSLYSAAKFINGAAFKESHFCDPSTGLPVVKIGELKSGITGQTKFSNRTDLDSRYRIDTGDILYSWSGSPDTSLDTFIWTKGPGLLNQHIFRVLTDSEAQKVFVYYLLKHLKQELIEIARNKQTTGLGHVTVGDMQRLLLAWPSTQTLSAFHAQFGTLFALTFSGLLESEKLAALRDYLLPRLLSGKVRVREAERGAAI